MAKIITNIILAACLLCSSLNSFSQVYTPERSCLIQVYKSQIGVREASGRNDGAAVEMYLKSVGLGKGYAWCAAFVKWCLKPFNVDGYTKITGAAASLNVTSKHVYFKRQYAAEILPGDVFTLWYARLGRIGHTGFTNGWSNRASGMIYTVEGNTNGGGSRDGDGVYLRIRNVGSIYSINRWLR